MPAGALKLTASTNYKINSLTSITLEFANQNPLDQNCQLKFTIPAEFSTDSLVSVSFRGGSYSASAFTVTGNTITVTKVNSAYVEAGTIGYVTLNQLKVPGSSLKTGSFLFSIADSSGKQIEQMTTGSATFQPTSGSMTGASVGMSQSMINQQGVKYTFTFTLQDSFKQLNALLVITCPSQIKITASSAKISAASSTVSGLVSASSAKVQSVSADGTQLVISNLFTKDYTGASGSISVTIDGFVNPSTVLQTDSFTLMIGYAADGSNTVE